MDAFLRCLRVAVGGCDYSRQGALWWVRRELPQTAGPLLVRHGLGFSQTLEQYGYCWFKPCIDWARLKFLPTITDLVLFGTGTLQQRYLKTGGHVRHFFDLSRIRRNPLRSARPTITYDSYESRGINSTKIDPSGAETQSHSSTSSQSAIPNQEQLEIEFQRAQRVECS